ncbi:MAG TPA: hypothetical protein ENK91_13730 [Bacteroidetes bacterium]|nr:hypothetical protein [Bacteroidota bacterium]
MKIKRIYFYLTIILIWSGNLYSQKDIVIETNIDSTLVGYDIPLQIDMQGIKADSFRIECLDYLQAAKVYLPKMDTSIANKLIKQKAFDQEIPPTDFEISDYGKWTGKGNTIFPKGSEINTIKIKIWDEGQFAILPSIITSNDTIYPENVDIYPNIFVSSGISPKDTLKTVSPIKKIIREEKNWKDYLWIYIVLGAIVLIGLLMWFLPRFLTKKGKEFSEKETIIIAKPAHEIALEKLNKLKEEKIWKHGKVKEFQSQLTYILREYLENRYKISALEQTTGEIVESLQKININTEDIDTITNILQIADMVKFAKAKPEEDINQAFLNKTIDFVNRTKEVLNN